ncbi:hypothetical protein ABPG73_019908 [Tetrahymena malaccensis]
MRMRYFFFLVWLIQFVQSKQCATGCQTCQDSGNSINQCIQCSNSYQLVDQSQQCEYQQCSVNQYFQIEDASKSDEIGKCVSICNPLYQENTFTNLCDQLQQCSSLFQTKQNGANQVKLNDLFVFQNQFYVALFENSLSIYDKTNLYLIETFTYDAGDVSVVNLGGSVFVITNTSAIYYWDIIQEQRLFLFKYQNQEQNFSLAVISIFNQFIFALINENTDIQLQIIYDQLNFKVLEADPIIIQNPGQQIKINNNIVVIQSLNKFIIYQISIDNSNSYNQKLINLFESINQQQQGNLISVLLTTQQEIILCVFENSIEQIDINHKIQSSLIQISQIEKVRYLDKQSQLGHLVIFAQQSLFDFDYEKKQLYKIIDKNENLNDFELGNFYDIDIQLAVLQNNNLINFFIYDDKNSKFINNNQTFQLDFDQQNLKIIPTQYNLNQTNNLRNYQEIVMNSSIIIKIIRKSSIKNQNLESKVIQNYYQPFPTAQAQVNSLVLIYNPSMLLTCHDNGDILFYDTSKGTHINLIAKKNFNLTTCIQIEILANNNVIALSQSKISLINIYLQEIESELNDINNLIQLTTNYDKIIINSNNCIQILSQELISLFQECQSEFSSNNLNVALNNDLKLIAQKAQSISIYQIDLTNKRANLINQLQVQNNIVYFNVFKIYNSDQDKLINNYIIDEIIYFDNQQSFNVYSVSFQLIYQIKIIEINQIIQVKRTINDSQAYFVLGQQILNENESVLIGILQSSPNYQILQWLSYLPFLDDSFMYINESGNTFYFTKVIVPLNFFTVFQEIEIDFQRNITYFSGFDIINIDSYTNQVKKMIGSPQNYINYVGTYKGIVQSVRQQQFRYKQINNKESLSQIIIDDQILEIQQSAFLGMYFVRTKYQVAAFSIFTNKLVEVLGPQNSNHDPFTYIRLLNDIQGVICWNQKQILLALYGESNSKYYYQGMDMINGVIFYSQSFYVYGTQFIILDQFLNQIQSVQQNQLISKYQQCENTKYLIICSISLSQFVILQKDPVQVKQLIQLDGFTYDFKLSVDEDYQNIFFYNQSIQVFNFQGVLKVKIPYAAISQFSFQILSSKYLAFQNELYIFVHDRLSLQRNDNYISAPSGFNIIKYVYVEYLQLIILYTNISTFSQIYIYDFITCQNIQKITQPFSQNKVGDVVAMEIDINSVCVLFLDTYGNLQLNILYNDFSIQNNFKITEILDRQEYLVGFSYDSVTSNIFVYSTSSIYQINYCIAGYKYDAQLYESPKLFASIPYGLYDKHFLIFNNEDNVFRYSQQNIQYELTIENSKIVDLLYDSNYDTLIFGLVDSILIYKNYQYLKNQNLSNQIIKIDNVKFQKFLSSNLYLTSDQKVLFCDIQSGKLIFTIQLNQKSIITKHLVSELCSLLLIGFSDGKLLQFDLVTQNYHFYDQQRIDMINSSVIEISLTQDCRQAIFITNGGILMKVDLKNQLILENFNFISILNEDPTFTLVEFLHDVAFQRYLFIFSGQKKVYVWNYFTNQLEKYLVLANDQGNVLKINEFYIFIQSSFQIAIYSLEKTLRITSVIQKNIQDQQILDCIAIKKSLIIIFYIYKYELFLLNKNENTLISQKTYEFSRLLDYIYNQNDGQLKVYGLYRQGVFEYNYNLNIQNNTAYTKCSIQIQDNDVSKIQQQVNSITPKQITTYSQVGLTTQNDQEWENTIYLQLANNQFQNINQFISQQKFNNTKFIFTSKDNLDNSLEFQNLQHVSIGTFSFANYSLQFNNDTSQQFQNIQLNERIQTIKWQNISISNQCLRSQQIIIQNVQTVIFQNLRMNQLSVCNSTHEQQVSSLFQFTNISSIYFYDTEISNNTFLYYSDFTLFQFTNVKNININLLKVTENKYIKNTFSFEFVANLTIQNAYVASNDNSESENTFIFFFQLKANYTISQYIDFTQASEISNRISSVSSQTNQNTEMTNIKQIQKKTSIFYESRSLSRKKTLNQQKPNFDLTDNKNFSTISNSSKQENDQLTIVTTEGAETPILKKKFSFLNNPKASLFLKRQDSDKTSPKADVSKIATLQYSQQLTEENDPKKVQRYSFTPKLFQLSSSKKSQNTFTFTTQDQEK